MDETARVLVVDDEEAARYGIVRALSSQGYELADARDGSSALDMMEHFRPDVIVCDINMPGLDGISLLRKTKDQLNSPLVILVTAYGSEERVLEALRAGAYDYVAKPFEVGELRVVVRNAVERQRLADENERYRAVIAQSERLAALGRLVAGVAHEMNNPLGVLLSGVDTLERVAKKAAASDPKLLDMANAAAKGAREAGSRLSRVVRNLKRFARIDEAEAGETRLDESLQHTIALLEHELEGIETVRDVDASITVAGSPSEWNDVLFNLLINAADAIARKTGGDGRVEIRIAREDDGAVLEVADNGDGIPPEVLPHIFDPGFTTKGVRVGTGLGLPICYRVAQSHGGTIKAESRPGEGTRFVIRVPLI